MRLFDLLSIFDASTNVRILENGDVLYEGELESVTQRILNCRFVNKSSVNNNVLLIETEQKSPDEIEELDDEE